MAGIMHYMPILPDRCFLFSSVSRCSRQPLLIAALFLLSCFASSAEAVSLEQVLQKGWNLISVPLEPADASPVKIFANVSQPLRVYEHSPNGLSVPAGQSSFTTVKAGAGYWVLANRKATLKVDGGYFPLDATGAISLHRGWNMIGLPWPAPYVWSSTNATVRNGQQTLSLADAVAEEWLRGELHSYNTAGGMFQRIPLSATEPQSLAPWKGYLLYSNIQGELVLTPPSSNNTPPYAEILTPLAGTALNTLTEITGTAKDDDLAQYVLDYAPAGSNVYTVLSIGTSSIENATLGSIDPTLLINGTYTLRLRATDLTGLTFTSLAEILVTGNQKPGLFSLTFQDLEVPLPGINIRITRTYDSRNKTQGDFGIGWTSEFSDVKVTETSILGLNWLGTTSGNSFCIEPTRKHIVFVLMPDGTVEAFEAVPNFLNNSQCSVFQMPDTTRFRFVPQSGATSQLVALDDPEQFILGSFDGPIELTYFHNLATYNPQRYRLTTRDKVILDIHKTNGLEKLTDPVGNVITVERNGISHSSGRSIAFQRDTSGRITAIQDPDGNILGYEYDSRGDLVKFTDARGNATRFGYDDNHLLVTIIDPLGRMAARNEYDEDGRLIASIDSKGNRIEFENDVTGREQIIRNQNGHVTRMVYDEDGNVLRDERTVTIEGVPTLASTVTEYDNGKPTREVSPDGLVKEWVYDAQGNVSQTVTDPSGMNLISQTTYDNEGKPLTVQGADGRTTSIDYGGAGGCCSSSISAINLPGGMSTQYVYDSQGRVIQTIDALGNYTLTSYDPLGNVAREEVFDATGSRWRRIDHIHDANGRLISETHYRTVNGATEAATTRYAYDVSGNVIASTGPLGHVNRFEYNAINQLVAQIDALGQRTAYTYDAVGDQTRITYPDNTFETFTYDARHNLIEQTDREGRTTRYEYDELDRQVRQIAADGTSTSTIFTPGGLTKAVIDENGNRTDYEYNSAGMLTREIAPEIFDASRQALIRPVIESIYDSQGRTVATLDPNGHRTEYAYDSAGRLTVTTFPDGATTEVRYDALGQTVEQIDAEGRAVRYRYDPLGRISHVILPPAAQGGSPIVTAYDYDERGNLLRITDANQHVTTLEYDALGRQVRQALPLGMAASLAYNAAGKVIAATDFNGHLTTSEYDINQRLNAINHPDSSRTVISYNKVGLATAIQDASGLTSITHTATSRTSRISNPDSSSIEYIHDSAGNLIAQDIPSGSASFQYDALNRLISVTSSTGQTTRYGYDAVGNRVYTAYPNSVTTTYEYDSRYRLRRLVNRGPGNAILSSYEYTVSPAGLRTRVVENSGRSVDYKYDGVYRLIEEKINDPVSGARTIAYTYDAVGNRLTRVDGGVTTTYAYDANDRLVSEQSTTTVKALHKGGALQGMGVVAPPQSLYIVRGTIWALGALYLGAIAFHFTNRRRRAIDQPRTAWLMPVWFTRTACLLLVPLIFMASEAFYAVHAEAALDEQLKSLATHITHTYDDNGNLKSSSDGTHTNSYQYDYANRLIEASIQFGSTPGVTRYAYNAFNRLATRTTNGQKTTYLVDPNRDLSQVLEEKTGGQVTRYLHGDDLISMDRAGSGLSYYLYDGQLSTRQLANSAGLVTDTYAYDAFGLPLSRTGATVNEYLYNGEQFDPNTGFIYLRARHYNPEHGRFISRDPFFGNTQDPVSLHKYIYAGADPVNRMDPTGLFLTIIEAVQTFMLQMYVRSIQIVNAVKALCSAKTVLKGVGYLLFFLSILFIFLLPANSGLSVVFNTVSNPGAIDSTDIKEFEHRFHFIRGRRGAAILEGRLKRVDGAYVSFVLNFLEFWRSRIGVGYNKQVFPPIKVCNIEVVKLEWSFGGNAPTLQNIATGIDPINDAAYGDDAAARQNAADYQFFAIGWSLTILKKIKFSIPLVSASFSGVRVGR